MKNLEKLNALFCDIFGVSESDLGPGFNNGNVDNWDSVRQLSLTTAIEENFDIFLDPEDIIACTSYDAVKAILIKYEIDL